MHNLNHNFELAVIIEICSGMTPKSRHRMWFNSEQGDVPDHHLCEHADCDCRACDSYHVSILFIGSH